MTSKGHLVVLATGGTGGHVFPAKALAAELAGRGCRMVVITDRRGGAWQGPADAIEMLAACFGGYHTAIHEQNAALGRANRLLASRVDRIAISFEKSEGLAPEAQAKAEHTGMPVRATVATLSQHPYPAITSDGPILLLVIGGSQGAHVFSTVVPEALGLLDDGLKRRIKISQQCRPEDLNQVHRQYKSLGIDADLKTFFDDLPERLSAAHLLIGRAGASTVAETQVAGRPAILVPYPYAIDDHQTRNAYAVDEAGGGWLMPEPSFTPSALAARLDSLLGLPAILEKAAAGAKATGTQDAAERLADMVCELLPNNGNGNGADGPDDERGAA